ncbi:MAG: hypothetical protein QOK09_787, partial [Mycobacterium sp.]|nr:hypothetical protein [Mycobacterium sp.]
RRCSVSSDARTLTPARRAYLPDGRVALLGDAAFCPSPVGGGGSTLALIGAYVLAEELSRTDDLHRVGQIRAVHAAAPRRRAKRPTGGAPTGKSSHPRGYPHTAHRGSRHRSPAVRAGMSMIGRRFGGVAGEDIKLPDYPRTNRSTTESAKEKI